MANFVSYNIPARRTKSARVRTYQRLKGVDFSSDEAQVALQRSPNSLNMYKNYSVERWGSAWRRGRGFGGRWFFLKRRTTRYTGSCFLKTEPRP